MKKNEQGITLLSLVITIVVLLIISSIVIDTSIKNSPMTNTINSIEEQYYEKKNITQNKVNEITNGWEDIIL